MRTYQSYITLLNLLKKEGFEKAYSYTVEILKE